MLSRYHIVGAPHHGTLPHRARKASIASRRPAVESLLTRPGCASAVGLDSVISMLPLAAAASKNSIGARAARSKVAPSSTAGDFRLAARPRKGEIAIA